MANIRQYIGARYVFKIYENSQDPSSAEWESNVRYEPLTIVTYLNSTYASKKDVPGSVGNPAANPQYWIVTGAYNGQIATLQQQIDTINNTTLPSIEAAIQALQSELDSDVQALTDRINNISVNRKYVLIGDSFGVGVQGASQEWSPDGWEYYFDSKHDDVFYYDPQGDQHFEGSAGFATNSGQNFVGQLNYVYNNKLGDTNPDTITDIIVLGGTNDIGTAEANIVNAIESFCTQAKTLFPNANISIGIWGLNGKALVNGSAVYSAYKKGSLNNGCAFLDDAILLGCNPTYDSTYGHFNLAGYTKYAPYIEELILTGHVKYNYTYQYTLTLDEADTPQYSFPYAIVFYVNERGFKVRIIDSSRYTPIILRTTSKLTDTNRLANMLSFPSNIGMYFPFNENMPVASGDCYYCDGNPAYIPFGKANVLIKAVNDVYKVQVISPYPTFFLASIINNASYDSYISFNAVGHEVPYIESDI